MAQYDELPVYKATYDLLLEMFRFTKDFSKEYKYKEGESLKKETIELVEMFEAYYICHSNKRNTANALSLNLNRQARNAHSTDGFITQY